MMLRAPERLGKIEWAAVGASSLGVARAVARRLLRLAGRRASPALAPGHLFKKRPVPREFPGYRSEVEILACSLPVPSHRLQYLLGVVEGVGAGVLYLVNNLLRRIVILEFRYDLILAGREVQIRQVLRDLSQVQIAQRVTQIAKAHVFPPILLSTQLQNLFYPLGFLPNQHRSGESLACLSEHNPGVWPPCYLVTYQGIASDVRRNTWPPIKTRGSWARLRTV